MPHSEYHRIDRIGWLRAALLGANDGLISTGSLVVGMAVAKMATGDLLLAATAALVAGALSMGAGEFVSVSSQADTENADLARERAEIDEDPDHENDELTAIYRSRGLSAALARQVATEMMAHDALGAHARDELGLYEGTRANPLQAALSSTVAFSGGALPPLLLAIWVPAPDLALSVGGVSLVLLAGLGGLAARLGGSSTLKGALRVTFWGALAMAATALVGQFFGVAA
jgi:VIT1/CCC1 family predicted Fe2+/Mn2+ transporter